MLTSQKNGERPSQILQTKKRCPLLIFRSNTVELVPPKRKPEKWIKNMNQNEPICLYHENEFMARSVISPMRNKVQFMNLKRKIAEKMISEKINLLEEFLVVAKYKTQVRK